MKNKGRRKRRRNDSRFSRHLVMSKDKKQVEPQPPKPTREKIKYQVNEKNLID